MYLTFFVLTKLHKNYTEQNLSKTEANSPKALSLQLFWYT